MIIGKGGGETCLIVTVFSFRVGHGNAKAEWYLESVAIGIHGMNCKISFHAGKWLLATSRQDELYPTLDLNTCDNGILACLFAN